MDPIIIETIVSVAAKLAVTLIGVLGAWLLAKISKRQELSNIAAAVEELTAAAQNTVLELQQTTVEGMKAATEDGKLTRDDVKKLSALLLAGAMNKMSASGLKVLDAAKVDVNAIITGAGEALIAEIKMGASYE